jgi:hypothetical protein
LEAKRTRLRSLRLARPMLLERLAGVEQREREQEAARKRKDWLDGVRNRDTAFAKLDASLRTTERAAQELERHRGIETERWQAWAEMLGGEPDEVAADEPNFPETSALRRVLADGPRPPWAKSEQGARQAEREREKQRRELLAWFRKRASERNLAQLPPGLHAEAREILAELEAERAEARERAAGAEREGVRLG